LLLINKVMPRAEGLPWVFAIAVLVLGGGYMVWRRGDPANTPLRVASLAGVLNVAILGLAGHVALYEDASSLLRAAKPHLATGDRVVSWHTFQPSLPFYLQRPIEVFQVVDNAGLDEAAMSRSPFFHKPDEMPLRNVLRGPARVVAVARKREVTPLPEGTIVWAANNDYVLFSNRPRPAELAFDFVAPRKK
jgi:hypothetical protein